MRLTFDKSVNASQQQVFLEVFDELIREQASEGEGHGGARPAPA